MTHTVAIPTLETDRLILRAPRFEDASSYITFKTSDRSEFTGGPIDAAKAQMGFAAIAGLWVLRGYGPFMAALKSEPDRAIGGFGIFHPQNQKEPEFGWSLYVGNLEGQGLVTEAMRTIIPWAWPVMNADTAQSHIDEGNSASAAVAKSLGATFDAKTTEIENAKGGEHHKENGPLVNIWRHHKGALR